MLALTTYDLRATDYLLTTCLLLTHYPLPPCYSLSTHDLLIIDYLPSTYLLLTTDPLLTTYPLPAYFAPVEVLLTTPYYSLLLLTCLLVLTGGSPPYYSLLLTTCLQLLTGGSPRA